MGMETLSSASTVDPGARVDQTGPPAYLILLFAKLVFFCSLKKRRACIQVHVFVTDAKSQGPVP